MKETLEDFIKRQLMLGQYQDQESAIKHSIELGAKWQAKRMADIIDEVDSELSLLEDRIHGTDGDIITKIRGILSSK